MAHFAEIDDDGIVLRVMVIANEEIVDKDGKESEALGRARCEELFGGNWIQASYNAKIRGRYPNIGDLYDAELDEFVIREDV